MRLAKFTASTQQLKKEGLYQMGARTGALVKVEKCVNCIVKLTEIGPIFIPERFLYFFTDKEIQAMMDNKVKIKNGKVK